MQRRKPKGYSHSQGGQFASKARSDDIQPFGIMTLTDAEEKERRAAAKIVRLSHKELDRVQNEAVEPGDEDAHKHRVLEARVKAMKTRGHETAVWSRATSREQGYAVGPQWTSVEDVPIVSCTGCGSVEIIEMPDNSPADDVTVHLCPVCVQYKHDIRPRSALKKYPPTRWYTPPKYRGWRASLRKFGNRLSLHINPDTGNQGLILRSGAEPAVPPPPPVPARSIPEPPSEIS